MIICPNCNHNEVPGALFCSECGAQLVFSDTMNTSAIQPDVDENKSASGAIPTRPATLKSDKSRIIVYLVDTGKFLPQQDRVDFTIGRVSEGQPIVPDVDLSPYQAFENGVSRLHAVVRFHENVLSIMDLGSSNGTHVNGMRLSTNVAHRLAKGDSIALGKFRIQIILNDE
jgi:pSer/pThr/pTyr-binding forkhead associated (FHA) protein